MKRPKTRGIINRFTQYSKQEPLKAALLVFVVVVGIGGGAMGVNSFFKNRSSDAATVELKVQTGEYGDLPSWWLDDYFGASVCQGTDCEYNADPDSDGLTNGQEYYYKSDPTKSDTNANGKKDGEDVAANIHPSKPGNVTFEDAASDDNIVSEGLAFEENIASELNKELDIRNVAIQVVPDSALDIEYSETREVFDSYSDSFERLIDQHFPKSSMSDIAETLEKGSDIDAMTIASNAQFMAIELRKMKVPSKLVNFHKYNIVFYQTLYELMSLNSSAADMGNPEGDLWFDKAQSLYAIMQKLNFEKQRLQHL